NHDADRRDRASEGARGAQRAPPGQGEARRHARTKKLMMATLIANAEIIAAAGAIIAVLAGIRLLRSRRRAARAAGRYRAAATRADANTATAGPPHAGAPASPPPSAAPTPGVDHRHLDDSDLKHLAAR